MSGLSYAQERLWFLDRLEPGSSEYVVSRALSLRGALDREALERALAEVVARHEVLRTWVEVVDGKPLLRVDAAAAQLDLPCTDLRELPRDEAWARARAAVEEQGSRTFDLARSPLVRAALIRLGDEEHVLCVSMHHIVTDGWSLGLLGTELGALYGAFARGEQDHERGGALIGRERVEAVGHGPRHGEVEGGAA